MPLSTCPECANFRGMSSIHYPWITSKDLYDKSIQKRLSYGHSGECSWPEFVSLAAPLKAALGGDLPVPPSSQFGQYRGKIFEDVPDLTMPGAGTLLARRNVVNKLQALGTKLRIFEVVLKNVSKEDDIVEIDVPPIGWSGPSAGIKWCTACDRGSVRKGETLDLSRLPPESDIFMLRDCPYFIILSSKLVTDIESCGFKGIRYKKMTCE